MSSKIIVGYLRVSTVEQADNGHSIDAQRTAITAAAQTRGWEICGSRTQRQPRTLTDPGLATRCICSAPARRAASSCPGWTA